jgi:hypothetical protein
MDKILPLALQKMKNDGHNSFMNKVKKLLESENMASHGFEKHIEELNLAWQAEDASRRVRRKSFLTAELVKLNAKREELYAGMLYQYESCLRHYDDSLRKAAKSISPIMKSIAYIHNTSNTIRHVYIQKITVNLRKPQYARIIASMQLQGWLDALDAANDNYQTMWMNRISEQAQQGDGNVGLKREVTDKTYQAIVKRVNALIIVDGPEEYAHFVRRLNLYIAEEKKSIAIREGWRKHKKEKKAEKEKQQAEESVQANDATSQP